MMLLLEPEQFAEIEYLVNQIKAMLNRVQQSAEWGPHYGPRILAYEVLWLAFWILRRDHPDPQHWPQPLVAYLLGSGTATVELNWVMMLISTVCWAASRRDRRAVVAALPRVGAAGLRPGREPVVLRAADHGHGAGRHGLPDHRRWLPGGAGGHVGGRRGLRCPAAAATIALVVGFRQNVVLDMIDRIVNLVTPGASTDTPRTPEV